MPFGCQKKGLAFFFFFFFFFFLGQGAKQKRERKEKKHETGVKLTNTCPVDTGLSLFWAFSKQYPDLFKEKNLVLHSSLVLYSQQRWFEAKALFSSSNDFFGSLDDRFLDVIKGNNLFVNTQLHEACSQGCCVKDRQHPFVYFQYLFLLLSPCQTSIEPSISLVKREKICRKPSKFGRNPRGYPLERVHVRCL